MQKLKDGQLYSVEMYDVGFVDGNIGWYSKYTYYEGDCIIVGYDLFIPEILINGEPNLRCFKNALAPTTEGYSGTYTVDSYHSMINIYEVVDNVPQELGFELRIKEK